MYHRWEGGGSKTVFGEGFYGMFCLPLSFPPPVFFSDERKNQHASSSDRSCDELPRSHGRPHLQVMDVRAQMFFSLRV